MKRWILCLLAALCCATAVYAQVTSPTPAPTPAPSQTAFPEALATPPAGAPASSAPNEVVIGAYINDIQNISLSQHAYLIDLYVWFRWTDPDYDPSKSVEFMNLSGAWDHQDSWAFETPERQPDGSLYNVLHHQSMFSNKFPLGAYPFDRQMLVVQIEDTLNASDAMVFKLDTTPVEKNPEIKLPGYELQPVRIIVRDKPYPTNFGELLLPEPQAYSHVDILIPVVRPLASGLLKVLAPILLIILTATAALLLDPEQLDARIGLGITALLTLVALQFTLLSGLPEVAYLTLLDQIFLASYGYILAVIGLVVRGSLVHREEGVARAKARGWIGAVFIMLIYFAGVGGLIYLNALAKGEPEPTVGQSYTEPV
jgi:hypothetical protein